MGKKKKTSSLIDESIVVKNSPFSEWEVAAPQKKKVCYKVKLKCKNQRQKEYAKMIEEKEIIFATGSAGTGKSYISLSKGLEFLSKGVFDKIIYIVPTCEAGSKRLSIGHLPGDFSDKTDPYISMVKENCEKILKNSGNLNEKKITQDIFESGQIEIKIMNFTRGSTFDNSFIIIDEAENFDTQEMLLLLTRIGENSKMCVMGDLKQSDRSLGDKNGLKHALSKLLHIETIDSIEFNDSDIVRNELIIKILHSW